MPPRGSPRGGRGGPPGANNRGGGGTARGGGPGRAGPRRGGPPRGSTGGRGGGSSSVGSRSGARGGVPAGGGSTLPPQQHSAILPVLVNHSLWNAHGQARLQQLNPDLAALGTTAERTRTTKALLKDVDALILLASAFKSQVNRLAHISRLAPEILLRIFHLLVEMYRPGEGYRRVHGWIEVTRVCRSWRHLLLGEHTIWANNIGTIPGAFKTFIERSGSHVPLHLYLEDELFEWPKYRPKWSALPLHRVHTLHCTISDQDYLEQLNDCFCGGSLLELANLQLISSSYYHHDALTIPRRNALGSAPALRSWTSTGCFLELVAPMLSNVKLVDVSVESTMLLRLLRNSPLLESFIANTVTINGDLNPVIHALSASLPRLRIFELQTAVQSSSATVLHNQLIAHLIFPDTANVSIQYSDGITSISDLNLLVFFMQTVPHDIMWSLKLHGGMFDFQILPSAVHTQYGRRRITLRAHSWERLVLILRDHSEVLSEHLGQRISKLHIGLSMKLQGPQDVTALAELYAILTSVRSIHTSDGSSAGGCLALAGNDTTSFDFPCPNLRRLRLGRELQHFEHYNEYTMQYEDELRYLNAQSIVEWLGPRVRAGMGPSVLRLDSIKQGSDAAVDPVLLALIPDARYTKDNDPDSDDEYM